MPRRSQPDKRILDLIDQEAWESVAEAFAGFHPADIAQIINHAPHESQEKLFSLLSSEVKPYVLSELEPDAGLDILEPLSNIEISRIVEEMPPDDAADVIADLPDERSGKVLDLMEKEESDDVRRLLEYADDTAGGIMTTDVVAMQEDQTVEEAVQAIAYLDTKEQFYYANIVGTDNKLIGYVDIWELLREKNKQRLLGELAHRNFDAATVGTDQEQVAQLMSKYDLTALPVVDNQGKLVGRITADDVIDVLEEEASEDILRLAGSDDEELERVSTARSCLIRLPWLFLTLLGSALISLLLNNFIHLIELSGILVLSAFVPGIFAMAGNTGIQSSTLLVRSIALGNIDARRHLFQVIGHEILVGAAMGCICGIAMGVWAYFLILIEPPTATITPLHLSVIVTVALFSSMTFAAMFGAIIPVTLDKMNIDPAIASGPFITITNDIAALLIYFGVTILFLSKLI